MTVIACSAALAVSAEAPGVTHVPPNAKNVRWWLGTWETNFGSLFFADIYRAKSDVPGPNDEPQYYWSVQGRWTMPGGRQARFHGAIDQRDHLVFQGCYEAKGPSGPCYPMLMYGDDATDRIAHGYWKPCFLPENCRAHHPWHGDRKSHEWRAGFRFTQRGLPDGHTIIRTQTGGAGTLAWGSAPVATVGDPGIAVHGSMLFTQDEIPDAPQLNVTVELRRGHFNSFGSRRDPARKATLEGLVTRSNDPHCTAGLYAAVVLDDRPEGKPDRIQLRIDGCRTEHWTSADPQRVNVHLELPKKAG